MKKLISVFLVFVMAFSCLAVPASAAGNTKVKYPIIFIAGSSVDFVDAEGKEASVGFDVLKDDSDGGWTKEDIITKTMNVLIPFFINGIGGDDWSDYGKALYTELAPIWENSRLDRNGNAQNGVGVSPEEIEHWDYVAANKNYGSDGTFNYHDYAFRYDWRLSPYEHVDRLHEYIKTVLKTTRCEKVCLVGRCLGGNVINAYLDTYGKEKLVAKVVYDEVMSNGSATVNDCFSGKIKFSDKHIQAYIAESEYFGKEDVGVDLMGINNLFLEIFDRILDLLTQTGAFDATLDSIELLYEKLYKAFIPAVLLATGIGTWPSYWTSLYEEDFDTALELIFGEEGSQTREYYAGLVDKILYLRERINIPRTLEGEENLYKKFEKECGVEIGILAGYGLLQPPVTESFDENGDCTVGVKDASFGATAAGVFDKLSEEYINERTAAGYGEYISADGKIDASTCLFPDTTWFIKNKHHDLLVGYYIVEKFCQYENFTISNNGSDVPRFLITKGISGFKDFEKLTAENCEDGPWLDVVEKKPTLYTMFFSLIRVLETVLKLLTEYLKGVLDLQIGV